MSDTSPNLKILEDKVWHGTPKYNFNSRLDLDKIETFEKAHGIVLSESHKQFLGRFNGGMITKYECTAYIDMSEYEADSPDRSSFVLFGLDGIIDEFEDLASDGWLVGDDFSGTYPIVPICSVPHSGKGFLFMFSEKGLGGESPVFAYLNNPDEKSCFQVAGNFNDFLGLYIEHEGFPPIEPAGKNTGCAVFMEKNGIIEIAMREISHEQKVERANAMIKLDPNDSWAYLERGNIYLGNGKTNPALVDFNKAIELNGEQPHFYYCRGNLILNYGSPRKALIDMDIAVKLDPGSKLYLVGRANALFKLGKLDKALADCNKVLDGDGNYSLALYARHRVYKAMGKDDLAKADSDLLDELS